MTLGSIDNVSTVLPRHAALFSDRRRQLSRGDHALVHQPAAKLQAAGAADERGLELRLVDRPLLDEDAAERVARAPLFAEHREIVRGLVPRDAASVALTDNLADRAPVRHEVDEVAPEQARDRQQPFGEPVVARHEEHALRDTVGHQHEVGRQQEREPPVALEDRQEPVAVRHECLVDPQHHRAAARSAMARKLTKLLMPPLRSRQRK